jgi:hypothetical protein
MIEGERWIEKETDREEKREAEEGEGCRDRQIEQG